jgi:hypothetical protein
MGNHLQDEAPITESAIRPITGRILPPAGFRVRETSGAIDTGQVLQVLRGELAGYRVRDFLTLEDCYRITDNFWSSTRRTPRYGEGEDGVEGYLIGASHIGRTTDEYLDDAAQAVAALCDLYEGTADPIDTFRELLVRDAALDGFRVATHGGRAASASKAVCWNNTGPFLLLPHDDVAQLSDPLQAGFEIQRVNRVMAVNVYPRVTEGTGQIQIWNVEPDTQTRMHLGLSHTGYPYPLVLLDDFQSLTIPVQAGDLCVINGNLVHAVRGAAPAGMRKRLLITCFMGLSDKGELLSWT